MEMKTGETASDWLFRVLSEEIISGRLKPEEKISEPEIARRHGISRAPVREAIRRLEERGFITRKPHLGPRVASFSIQDFLEISEIRASLEGTACRLAASRMSEEELSRLRRLLEEHERHLRTRSDAGYDHKEREMDFHYLIASGSRNSALKRLLCEDYYNLIKLYRKRFVWLGTDDRMFLAAQEHFRILAALEQRDGEVAEILMRRHIESARKKTIEEYEKISR